MHRIEESFLSEHQCEESSDQGRTHIFSASHVLIQTSDRYINQVKHLVIIDQTFSSYLCEQFDGIEIYLWRLIFMNNSLIHILKRVDERERVAKHLSQSVNYGLHVDFLGLLMDKIKHLL